MKSSHYTQKGNYVEVIMATLFSVIVVFFHNAFIHRNSKWYTLNHFYMSKIPQ